MTERPRCRAASSIVHNGKRLGFLLIAVMLISCAGYSSRGDRPRGVYHRVKSGETLSAIAKAYQVNLQDLAEVNNIGNSDQIEADSVIFIPDANQVLDDVLTVSRTQEAPVGTRAAGVPAAETKAAKPAAVAPPEPPKKETEAEAGKRKERVSAEAAAKDRAAPLPRAAERDIASRKAPERAEPAGGDREVKKGPVDGGAGAIQFDRKRFIWPVKGRVVTKFGTESIIADYNGKKVETAKIMNNGIKIAAGVGTPVMAAADGKVIYSMLLERFGNTIIIEHTDDYKTVYYDLGKRSVEPQQQVKKGDPIATIGENRAPKGEAFMQFEIRHKNRPRNPLFFFPERDSSGPEAAVTTGNPPGVDHSRGTSMILHDDCSSFEQGPIRPPSESQSLLVRVTRNCPWNRCAFCHTYQGEAFSLRTVAEIKEEILRMAGIAERIRALGGEQGNGQRIGEEVVQRIFRQGGEYAQQFRSVASWLYYGGDSVFLQDANSLVLNTDDLEEILSFLRRTFPAIRRITTYARAKTAAQKTSEELKRLREAGLSRIHVGMESGYDPLLRFIKKGVTAAELVEGGLKIREAGISLCEYVMPGLGGSRWSSEHALETARVLNRINPDHIRLRTLQVVDGSPLDEKVREGGFQVLDDDAILREIRLFLATLEGISSEVVSDHILNLLEELEGRLPGDRERMFGVIDRFFLLSLQERMIFRMGRRMGIYRCLDDLADDRTFRHLEGIVERYGGMEPHRLEQHLAKLRSRHI